jgi:hypothetical protein
MAPPPRCVPLAPTLRLQPQMRRPIRPSRTEAHRAKEAAMPQREDDIAVVSSVHPVGCQRRP